MNGETLHAEKRAADVQVGAHDNLEIGPGGDFALEQLGVFHRLFGRVNGARADDDEESLIVASDDPGSVETRLGDGALGCLARLDLMQE